VKRSKGLPPKQKGSKPHAELLDIAVGLDLHRHNHEALCADVEVDVDDCGRYIAWANEEKELKDVKFQM
jgi:hypothetical protein